MYEEMDRLQGEVRQALAEVRQHIDACTICRRNLRAGSYVAHCQTIEGLEQSLKRATRERHQFAMSIDLFEGK
jgi:hypothetical protein